MIELPSEGGDLTTSIRVTRDYKKNVEISIRWRKDNVVEAAVALFDVSSARLLRSELDRLINDPDRR